MSVSPDKVSRLRERMMPFLARPAQLHCNSKRFTVNLPGADVISCIHSHFHLHPSTQPPRSHSSPFKSVSSLRCTGGSYHQPPRRTATLHQGMCAKSLQSCPTLCNPRNVYSLPGSSVRGILQARILERVAMPFLHSFSPAAPELGTFVP